VIGGSIFGGACILLGAACIIAGGVLWAMGQSEGLHAFLALFGSPWLLVGVVVGGLLLRRERAKLRRFDYFMRAGIDAVGEVLHSEPITVGRGREQRIRRYRLELRVTMPDAPAYTASVVEEAESIRPVDLHSGVLTLKVDPADPSKVFVVPR
jgi:hypothetical protein